MHIDHLYRFPVKGLTGEPISSATVRTDGAIPYDRIYAIAHGATRFDPENPLFLSKRHFLMLMSQPRMAALKLNFEERDHHLTLAARDGREAHGSLRTAQGRADIDEFLGEFAGDLSSGGAPRVVSAPEHRFFDVPDNFVSIIALASIEDLASRMQTPLDPLRFRANIYLAGTGAWEEQSWIGRAVVCGDVVLRIVKPIDRCAATNVNLKTAEFDVNVPASLMQFYRHRDMGVYARIEKGGTLAAGATLQVQD